VAADSGPCTDAAVSCCCEGQYLRFGRCLRVASPLTPIPSPLRWARGANSGEWGEPAGVCVVESGRRHPCRTPGNRRARLGFAGRELLRNNKLTPSTHTNTLLPGSRGAHEVDTIRQCHPASRKQHCAFSAGPERGYHTRELTPSLSPSINH